MESKSIFIQLNNTDKQQIGENGLPINGAVFYANDYDSGKKTILRFIDGFLDGDIFDENGNFIMQKPAVEGNGHLEYWRKNKLHRDNNEPAVCTNGFTEKEWWENGVRIMKTTKEFPATHSMSTEWFVADEEGNIALFDFEEEGPVPVQINEADSFSYMEDLCVPDENGINTLELSEEQIGDMLKHFKPISEFTENDDYSCLVQVADDENCLKGFLMLFKDGIECCLSHKERIFLVHDFLKYDMPEDLEKKILDSIKQVCTGFYQAVCEGDYLSSKSEPVYPFFCYQQPYNSSVYLPERTAVPAHPLKESQIPEEKRKKLIRIPVRFSECTGFQIAQYVLCKRHSIALTEDITRNGRVYAKYPKTGGGFCYILEDQDIEKDGETPIIIDGEENNA